MRPGLSNMEMMGESRGKGGNAKAQVHDAFILFWEPQAKLRVHRPGCKILHLGNSFGNFPNPGACQETSEATGTHSPSPATGRRF